MLKSVFPVVITDKLTLAVEFYVTHLSFRVVFEANWYVQLHAERGTHPPLELAFMSPNQLEQHKSVHPSFSGEGIVLTFEFEDVDTIYNKLMGQHAITEILVELKDEPWGQRHFMFRDPAGIIVDIVQLIQPSAEYDLPYNKNLSYNDSFDNKQAHQQ